MSTIQDISILKESGTQGKKLGKKTPMQDLDNKVKEYISRADDIMSKDMNDLYKGLALGRLFKYICSENGGYANDVHDSIMTKEERYIAFMKRWHLYADAEDWKEGEILVCFLKAVENAIKRKGGGLSIDGRYYKMSGWEWHPDSGIEVAQVVLWALLDAIYRFIDYLRVQIEIETGKDMGMDIAPKKTLCITPYHLMGAQKRENQVEKTVPVAPPSVKVEIPKETLTSKYDAKRLLAVYKNLTEKGYLYCTEEAWLYVWGVRVHPTNRTEIKAPAKIPRWSAMQGKKTAIGDMIKALMATDCGKHWKKTAKLFVFSDGSQPVEKYLKSYGLKGPAKTEFLKLVSVH